MKIIHTIGYVMILLCLCSTVYGQGVNTCANYTANGDVYPCCTDGNCTWWAWAEAQANWGINLPNWHNAANWATNARASGYNVINIPSPGTIAVNTTASGGLGHVAWITQVNNDGSVYVAEMDCGSNGAFFNKLYSANFFNAGYIYNHIYDGTPYIGNMSPGTIRHSGSGQSVTFGGSNPGFITAVYVTYPGGHAILTGSGQITAQNYSSFTVIMTMGIAGTYSVAAVNNNGTVSNTYSFTVN